MSGYRSTLSDIRDGVRSQPGRVGLAFLAIGVGIMALTVLLAVLGGLRERSRRIVEELGVNVFGIAGQSRTEQAARSVLQDRHVAALEASLPDCVVTGLSWGEVSVAGVQHPVKVVRADHALVEVRQWKMRAGRFLDREDMRTSARHVVVGTSLARQHGWSVGDPIALRNIPYQVVGMVDVGGGALDSESGDSLALGDRVVFVPRTTPAYWREYGNREDRLDGIFVLVPTASQFRRMVARAQRVLVQPDQRVSGLSWITPDTLLERITRLQNTIKLTVGSIAILCLILGGTTLMSLMVANVRDRVVEIGLRRALGATPQDIATLFVLEGSLVTGAAALAGTLVTWLVLLAGRDRFPVPVSLGAGTVLVPLIVAVGLGLVFSYWPAASAARIAPSEALRNE